MADERFEQVLKRVNQALAAPGIMDVPPLQFLMIDGHGDPNHSALYEEALAALYALAYGIKFACKRRDPALDFKVPALEGLWWADDMTHFTMHDRTLWRWTMLLALPENVVEADLVAAVADAERKGKTTAVRRVRLEAFHEGLCAQVLHVGPYSAEPPTIERLHAYIAEQGYQRRGKHHEIYLGDPRRTAPEKLKTIIRQPIAH